MDFARRVCCFDSWPPTIEEKSIYLDRVLYISSTIRKSLSIWSLFLVEDVDFCEASWKNSELMRE